MTIVRIAIQNLIGYYSTPLRTTRINDLMVVTVRYTLKLHSISAMETKNTLFKKQVLDLFCAVSFYSNKGHQATLDAVDYFKVSIQSINSS